MAERKNLKALLSKMRFLDKLKAKKYTSYVVAIVLSLVVVVIFLSSCQKQKKSNNTLNYAETKVTTGAYEQSYSEILENKLVNVLSFVKGCGSVRAMVVTKSTNISEIEMQSEEKTTSSGGSATNSPIYEKNGSQETPFVSSYIYPEIIGVLVVAQGAGDTNVRLKIVNAIVSVLGVDSSKIEVLEGK